MIKKSEVRQRLSLYEKEIRDRKVELKMKMNEMCNACGTMEMLSICKESQRYTELRTEYQVLGKILYDIIDIRCDEMLED